MQFEKDFRRDRNTARFFQALFPFLLFLPELHFARPVASVEVSGNVFFDRRNGLARDDPPLYDGLKRYRKKLTRQKRLKRRKARRLRRAREKSLRESRMPRL